MTNNTGAALNDVWVRLENLSGGILSLATNEDGLTHVGPMAAGATKQVYFYLKHDSTLTGDSTTEQTHRVVLYPSNPTPGGVTSTCNSSFSYKTDDTLAAAANKLGWDASAPSANLAAVSISPTEPVVGGELTMIIRGLTGQMGGEGLISISPAVLPGWRSDVFELQSVDVDLFDDNTGALVNEFTSFYAIGKTADPYYYEATFKFKVKGTTASSTTILPSAYISSGNETKHNQDPPTDVPAISPPTNSVVLSGLSANTGNSPACLASGQTVTMTLTLSNPGSVAVSLDTLSVTLPTGVGYVSSSSQYTSSSTASIPNPTQTGQVLEWSGIFDVAAGGTSTLTFNVTIPNSAGTFSFSGIGNDRRDTNRYDRRYRG